MLEPNPDHVEGVFVSDIYDDLYDIVIQLAFLEGKGMLMDNEQTLLNSLIEAVHIYNEDWMDTLMDIDDSDDCFDDGFSNPENMND